MIASSMQMANWSSPAASLVSEVTLVVSGAHENLGHVRPLRRRRQTIAGNLPLRAQPSEP